MRSAVIVAPWDPATSGTEPWGTTWTDWTAWLGAALSTLGFQVVTVDIAEDFAGNLADALQSVAPQDGVLVHVSGYLERAGTLRAAGGRSVSLEALGATLVAGVGSNVSVVAELVHPDAADDPLVAAEHLAASVAAIGAEERGLSLAVAVRSAQSPLEGLAFTKLLLTVASEAAAGQARVSAAYEAAVASPEALEMAQSYTLVRGRTDVDLAPSPEPPPASIEARIEAATASRDWALVVSLRRERLATLESPRLRGKELVAIARTLQGHLSDAEGALEALEEARAIEPSRLPVLQALRRGYETLGRWASAIEVAGAMADLAPGPAERAALRVAQARMAIDHLQDEERALTWLEQAMIDDPANADAQSLLGHIRASLTPPEALRPEPSYAPPPVDASTDELDPAVYQRLHAQRAQAGRADAAGLAALALEELGAIDPEPRALVEQQRSVAPVRARGTIDASAWTLLRPAGMDPVMRGLFGAVARAAVQTRLEQLTARKRLVTLDPRTRLPETSTASVVRTFQWAARVLGMPSPELYAVPEVPGEIAAVRAPGATTAVGPSIMSGRSTKDLAFLAGRHLTYYAAEHQAQIYYPTRDELTRLILAAVQVAKPGLPPAGDESRTVVALADRLDRRMDARERAALAAAVRELEARGGRFSLGAWTRDVELMAARTGLLLCGDLATAMGVVRTESRAIAGLTLDAKRRDLVAFCASEEHAELRARFAVTSNDTQPAPSVRIASV